jgi:Protein of unknown function (DUF2786)
MNQNLLNKLQKLLALGNSTSENESRLAIEKAQELAAENNIDLAIVALQDQTAAPEEMLEKSIGNDESRSSRLSVTHRFISWILQNHFSVTVLTSGNRFWGRRVSIVGEKTDVEFALYIHSFLSRRMMHDWRYYAKSHGLPARERKNYLYGYYEGLKEQLNKSKQRIQDEKFNAIPETIRNDVRNKYALIIQTKEVRVKDFLNKLYPRLGHGTYSSLSCRYGDTYSAGREAGSIVNLNRPLTGQLTIDRT